MFLKPGDVVEGRYIIQDELGGGGYATVYLAEDQRLNKTVALKQLQVTGTTSDAHAKLLARFEGEAKIAAQLKHRCSVEVTDYGLLPSGKPFLIMEYIDGPTLAEALEADGAMGAERVKALWLDTLEALAEAHLMGVVHRDLKPENLMLADIGTRRERLVILDFGIARRMHDSDRKHSTTRGMLGTPAYMPPELLVDASKATAATDVFQVGLILAEMLTGERRIQADSIGGMFQLYQRGDWTLPDALAHSPFGPLLDRALRLDPDHRFPDASALRDALDAVDLSPNVGEATPRLRVPTMLEEDPSDTGAHAAPSRSKQAWAGAGALGALGVGLIWALSASQDAGGDKAERTSSPAVPKRKAQADDAATANEAPRERSKPKPEPTKPAGMVYVDEGYFIRGSNHTHQDEAPQGKVWLDAYWIDTHEVTVRDYAACVKASACTAPQDDRDFHNWSNGAPRAGRLKHPINGVSWAQAAIFCAWKGKRLPTEAEWEKAARGTDGRTYPWGEETPSCAYAVINNVDDGCGEFSTWEVGSKPAGASPYGVHDMAGNVQEWTADWYDDSYYASADGKKRNPKGPPSASERAVRGGSWVLDGGYARVAQRNPVDPSFATGNVGFRCAKSL